jgi:glycosyltransferase involved in cell wall biosynthesis
MSCGLPLVVYNNGALPRSVANNNGILVENNNIGELSKAIVVLSQKPKENLIQMAKMSMEIAQRCDIRNTSKIKLDWFDTLIKSNKR